MTKNNEEPSADRQDSEANSRVFISHGTPDQALAEAMRELLTSVNVPTYLAHQDISGGDDWRSAIRTALSGSNTLLSLCTVESIYRPWLIFEAGATWLGKRAVPLRSVGVSPKDLPSPLQGWQSYSLTNPNNLKTLLRSLADRELGAVDLDTIVHRFVGVVRRLEGDRRLGTGLTGVSPAFLGSGQGRPKTMDVLTRGTTDFLDDGVVDAVIYIGDRQYQHSEDLASCIRDGLVPSTKFLYQSLDGCQQWLDRCNQKGNQRGYTYYSNAIRLLKDSTSAVSRVVKDTLGTTAIDLISLGCGNGEKDAILIGAFVDELVPAESTVYYYPVDINAAMIAEAVRNVRSALPVAKRSGVGMKIMAATDFTKLNPMKAVYEWRDGRPNVWSVLGNTLGNASERELLESLSSAAESGDLLLLEVATGSDLSHHYHPTSSVPPQGAAVLAGLGVDLNHVQIEVEQMGPNPNRASVVPGTRTLVYTCRGLKLPGESRSRDARLSYIHYYDQQQLADYLKEYVAVAEIAWYTRGDGVSLFVGQFA